MLVSRIFVINNTFSTRRSYQIYRKSLLFHISNLYFLNSDNPIQNSGHHYATFIIDFSCRFRVKTLIREHTLQVCGNPYSK